jgi:cytochrome c oxidase subunit 4
MDAHQTTGSHEAAHDDHEEHLVPYKVFIGVWAALVTLTLVTVGASYLDLKQMTMFTALLIACVKGSLVILYFMHMRWDKPVLAYFLIACLGTYAVFVALTFADYYYR